MAPSSTVPAPTAVAASASKSKKPIYHKMTQHICTFTVDARLGGVIKCRPFVRTFTEQRTGGAWVEVTGLVGDAAQLMVEDGAS